MRSEAHSFDSLSAETLALGHPDRADTLAMDVDDGPEGAAGPERAPPLADIIAELRDHIAAADLAMILDRTQALLDPAHPGPGPCLENGTDPAPAEQAGAPLEAAAPIPAKSIVSPAPGQTRELTVNAQAAAHFLLPPPAVTNECLVRRVTVDAATLQVIEDQDARNAP